jgi:dihydrofolate reductase
VRLRSKVTKVPGSRAAGLAMAFKLIEAAEARRRAVNAPHLVALVRAGAVFEKGKPVERPVDSSTTKEARLTLAHPQGFDNVSCGVAMSFALRCSLISMGKLIYGFNVSVDGYIADAQGNIDWTDPSEELHQYWNDFERETALSFYGRRLYELMSAYWPTADKAPDATPLIVDFAHIWRDMPKVVFSRTLESVDWNSRLERGDPVDLVTKLKAETDGRLEVAGATLAAPIVQAGLVDEYRIVVTPTAVGGGTPFFPTLPSWISLRLLENRTFPGGTVLLRYEAKHD